MADYNANIRVSADTTGAERALRQLEQQISKLGQGIDLSKSVGRGVTEALVPQKALKQIDRELATIASRADTTAKKVARIFEGGATLGVAAKGIQDVSQYLQDLSVRAGEAVDSLAQIPDVAKAIVPGLKPASDATNLLAKSISTLEYNFSSLQGGADAVVNLLGSISPVAATAGAGIAVVAGAIEDQLLRAMRQLDTEGTRALQSFSQQTQQLLKQLASFGLPQGGTLAQFEQLLGKGQARLRNSPAGSPESLRAINTILRAEELITEELKKQDDLIRSAQGLRTADTENRATNTYRTTQNRKTFLSQQASDIQDLQAALGRMQFSGANPFGIGPDQQQEELLTRYTADMKELQQVLGSMEGQSRNPFGITAEQIEIADYNTKKWKADLEQVNAELADLIAVERALGQMEGRTANPFGIEQQQIEDAYNYRASEEKAFSNLRLDTIQRQLNAELDSIDAVFDARTKANAAAEKDFDRRLKARGDTKKQGNQRLESLALGVGFPLLFGGGAGTTIGSFAGSFVGSGFGGQILGGAFGQIIDQFIAATTDLGKALLSTTKIFDTLKEASLISSRGLEKTIDRLQEAGFAATASATAQRDLSEVVGRDGVRNLLALGDAADRGSRAFAEAVTRFQSRIAGPLGRAQGFLARGGEISNLQNRVGDVAGQLQRSGRSREAQQLLAAANPFGSFGKSQDQVISELQAALKKAEESLPPLKIRLDAKQIRDELLTTLNKQLEAIDLGRNIVQQVRERARAQEDLDTQRADMLLQQERAIGDLRRSIEDRIADIRLSNVQRENELLDVQAQIRLQSLKNSNLDLRNGFTNDQVSGAANAVADYLEAELQTANDAAKIKRDAALEVQRLDIEAERFKLQTAIQVSRLNQDTAKQVASIQRNVFRQNQDQDNRRFELEKELAKLRLQGLATEFALLAQQGQAAQRKDIATLAKASLSVATQGVNDLERLKAPAALRFNASGLGGFGVSTSGVDAANAQAKQLLLNLEAAKQALLDLVSSGNLKQLQESLDNTFVKPLQKAQDEANGFWETVLGTGVGMINNDQAKKESALGGLLTQLGDLIKQTNDPKVKALLEGIAGDLPAMTRETDAAVTTSELLGTLQDDLAGLQDRYIALQTPTGELTKSQQIYNELVRNNISLESERAKKLLELAGVYDQVNAQVTEQERMQQSLNELYSGISGELVNGVSRSLDLVAQSTENVGEAMRGLASDILRTVGKMLIFQGLAQLFGGILGGGSANPQGIFSSIGKAFGFAEGGFVTKPTNAVIGEGGEPEYIIPASKMRGAMSRYASGTRGPAVIPAGGGSEGTAATALAPASIDVRYTVERINSVDYVTADQFQSGLQQAAAQGAERGQQLALRRLQQSPSTRRRVGI